VSSADLPSNLDEWPDDPYEILGVAHDANERDVKRAYTRRIKLFKPEHHPLHFRRLRDAYEWICTYGLSDTSTPAPDQIVLETASTLWDSSAAPPAGQNPRPAATPADPVAPRDRWQQLTAAWQQACAGDVGEVYANLVAQLALSTDVEIYTRLYWLLFAAPDVDAIRAPVEWLAEGIARYGFNGQLAALYIQELRARPAEATSERCRQMLAAQQQPGAIIDLLAARWLAFDALDIQATYRARWADAIFDDVEQVRPRLRLFDEQALTRALSMAIEHLSWRPTLRGADLAKLLVDELNQTEFAPRDVYYQLDHMENVLANSGAWRRAQRAHPPKEQALLIATILDVIRTGALQPSEENHAALEACLQQIADAPGEALVAFDFIESKGAGVTNLFANMLNVMRYENEHDRFLEPNEWCKGRLLDFVFTGQFAPRTTLQWSGGWTQYNRWRASLLDACLRHCVSPRTVRELVEGNDNLRRVDGVHLADLIGSDVSLDCVFEASRLFWA
jgi:hypothetical protein